MGWGGCHMPSPQPEAGYRVSGSIYIPSCQKAAFAPRLWKGKLSLRAVPGGVQRLALPLMPLLFPQEKAAARERRELPFPQPQQC